MSPLTTEIESNRTTQQQSSNKQGDCNGHPCTGLNKLFGDLARQASGWMGSPWAFLVAVSIIIVWAVTGPFLDYSDTWQLVINTGTTIVTFLMVFLIQNSQNRDARAIQLKLDELIRAIENAQNDLIDVEKLSDEELGELEKKFEELRNTRSESAEAISSGKGTQETEKKPRPK
ncbi:MAG: low affinity iron permease family protein [Planctomycetales bacterium]